MDAKARHTKANCEICRGSGFVRLPVFHMAPRSMIDYDATTAASRDDSSRTYPCPECAGNVPQERLALVQYHSLVDSRINDPQYMQYAKRGAAHALVDHLLKDGFIRFERAPDDFRNFQFPMRATLGVVSTTNVATLEQRVAENQEQLAREVINEAAAQISIWGSHYTGDNGSISKAQAIDSVNGALAKVLAKRSAVKVVK